MQDIRRHGAVAPSWNPVASFDQHDPEPRGQSAETGTDDDQVAEGQSLLLCEKPRRDNHFWIVVA